MKKKLIHGVAIFSLIVFVSCNHSLPKIDKSLGVNSSQAQKNLDLAYEEAYNLLSIASSRNVCKSEIDPNDYTTWELRDKLEAAAWLGIQTEDASEVIKIAKENDVYDKLMEIAKKYDINECIQSVESTRNIARTISSSEFDSLKTGDILLSRTLSSSGGSSETSSSAGNVFLSMLTKGYFKHSGIVDRSAGTLNCVLSASNNNSEFNASGNKGLGAVGYESKDRWTSNSYHIAALRVKNYDPYIAEAALEVGRGFKSKPYGFSGRDSNENFYCSKVVYRCWASQGYDLEYHTKWYAKGLFVTPQDLYDDDDTEFLYGNKPE